MPILETSHKRKSAVITVLILALLIFAIFTFGMKYLDPPEEYGLAINFGTSEVGSGDPVEETIKQESLQNEESTQVFEEPQPQETTVEDVITDDAVKEVPVVEKKTTKEPEKQVEKKVVEEKPKKVPKKPSKATQDALNSLLNGNASDGQPKGEGDDTKPGVKGNEKGDVKATNYYGNAGSGFGGNYNLSGRKALSKPIQKPDCQEEGIVVVRIEVDKKGRVINVVPGVKGSTNTAPCLLKPAKEAALKTTWNADDNAPIKQTGTIIYRFSLTK